MSETSIEELLEQLITLNEQLATALADERSGLAGRDLEGIAKAAEAKAAACAGIESLTSALGPVPLSAQIADLAPQRRASANRMLDELRELAGANRRSNATNGKILHRSQHVVRELVGLLSGVGPDAQLLYEANGHTQATTNSGAIAQA